MGITNLLGAGASFLTPYKAYIIMGALVALVVGEFFFVRDIYVTKGELAITNLVAEQQQEIIKYKDKVRKTEGELATAKLELENENVANKKKLSANHTYYTDLIAKRGLHDPGKKTTCNPVPNNPGAVGGDQGSGEDGRLSDEASKFLLALTREANEMKADYTTCFKWKAKVQKVFKDFEAQAKP